MARRHLGYGVEEWRALPWWVRRLYAEHLVEELTGEEVSPPIGPEQTDDLAALGLTVRRVVAE